MFMNTLNIHVYNSDFLYLPRLLFSPETSFLVQLDADAVIDVDVVVVVVAAAPAVAGV